MSRFSCIKGDSIEAVQDGVGSEPSLAKLSWALCLRVRDVAGVDEIAAWGANDTSEEVPSGLNVRLACGVEASDSLSE